MLAKTKAAEPQERAPNDENAKDGYVHLSRDEERVSGEVLKAGAPWSRWRLCEAIKRVSTESSIGAASGIAYSLSFLQ